MKLESIKIETMDSSNYSDWEFQITNYLREMDLYELLKSQSRSLNKDVECYQPVVLTVVQPTPEADYENVPTETQELKLFEMKRQDQIRRYKEYVIQRKDSNKLIGILNSSLPETEVNRVADCQTGGQMLDILREHWLKKSSINFDMAIERLHELSFDEQSIDLLKHINQFKIRMKAVQTVALEGSGVHESKFVTWFLDSIKTRDVQLEMLIMQYRCRQDLDTAVNLFKVMTNQILHWWNTTKHLKTNNQMNIYNINKNNPSDECIIIKHAGHTNQECILQKKYRNERKELPISCIKTETSNKRPYQGNQQDSTEQKRSKKTHEINNGNCIKCNKKYYRNHECNPDKKIFQIGWESNCFQCGEKGWNRGHRCDTDTFIAFRKETPKRFTTDNVNFISSLSEIHDEEDSEDQIKLSTFMLESSENLNLEFVKRGKMGLYNVNLDTTTEERIVKRVRFNDPPDPPPDKKELTRYSEITIKPIEKCNVDMNSDIFTTPRSTGGKRSNIYSTEYPEQPINEIYSQMAFQRRQPTKSYYSNRIVMLVDSGAQKHVTNDYGLLSRIRTSKLIQFSGATHGRTIETNVCGDIIIENEAGKITFENVYYHQDFRATLISCGKLSAKYTSTFGENEVQISETTTRRIIIRGKKVNDLYLINVSPYYLLLFYPLNCLNKSEKETEISYIYLNEEISTNNIIPAIQTKALIEQNKVLQHMKHGHFYHPCIKTRKIKGIDSNNHTTCSDCAISKSRNTWKNGPSKMKATQPLQLMHIDLIGPMRVTSIQGSKYLLVIVDNYSNMRFIAGLKNKSMEEVFAAFMKIIKKLESLTIFKLQAIHSDNGTEFNKLRDYCKEYDIHYFLTHIYQSEENGIVERTNQTLENGIRVNLLQSLLSLTYFEFVAIYCVYTLNRIPNKSARINSIKTPIELFFNVIPKTDHLQPFGSLVIAYKNPKKYMQSKIEPYGEFCRFLGYSDETNGYILYEISTGKIISRRAVKFYPNVFANDLRKDEININAFKPCKHCIEERNLNSNEQFHAPIKHTAAEDSQIESNQQGIKIRFKNPEYNEISKQNDILHISEQIHKSNLQTFKLETLEFQTENLRLKRHIFLTICNYYYKPNLDLFANYDNKQTHMFFGNETNKEINKNKSGYKGHNSLNHSWNGLRKLYAFPPSELIPEIVYKLQKDDVEELILVVPYTPGIRNILEPVCIHKPLMIRSTQHQVFTEDSQTIKNTTDIAIYLISSNSVRNSKLENKFEYKKTNYNLLPETIETQTTITKTTIDPVAYMYNIITENNFNEPKSYKQAQKSPQADHWASAIHREVTSLEENNTWKIVKRNELPRNVNILKSKWVFTIKYTVDGLIDLYKARCVVRGDLQKQQIDYLDVYSPVASYNALRLLMCYFAMNKMSIHSMDVSTAFLNPELKEDIYMDIPDGISVSRIFSVKYLVMNLSVYNSQLFGGNNQQQRYRHFLML